jgi:chloride channel protein, CIC family
VSTQTTSQPNVSELQISFGFWGVIVLTGGGAGLTGGLLMRLLWTVQHLSYSYRRGDFLHGVEQVSGLHRLVVMVLAGLVAGIVLYAIKHSGIVSGGSLSEAIWKRSGTMSATATLIRSLLSIVTVGMGAALGREGALKDTGGVVANRFSDWFGMTPAQRQLLVACGAGAGMAAAYNVPLGGALFAAEVLLGSLSLATVLPAFVASFTGVAVSWLLLPNAPAYIFPALEVSHSLILWSVIAGPVIGFLSIGYVRAIGWAQTHKPTGWRVLVLPLIIFTALGLAAMKFPQLLGNGKNIVQLTFFNQLGAGLLCWLIVLRPLATLLCLRSGAPGGLFTPTMTLGAMIGEGMGRIWNHIAAGNEMAGYAMIGSAALLAAATLGPLSSAVFLLELTRHADPLMVPLLIATAGATVTARRYTVHSIYSIE